jgi:phosphoribosylanthranilate isomerase
MIMWPKAKRSVSDDIAADIARVAKEHGAQPVGVFVDEDAATIQQRCQAAGIGIAQLHGDPSRACLSQVDASLKVSRWLRFGAVSICVDASLPKAD